MRGGRYERSCKVKRWESKDSMGLPVSLVNQGKTGNSYTVLSVWYVNCKVGWCQILKIYEAVVLTETSERHLVRCVGGWAWHQEGTVLHSGDLLLTRELDGGSGGVQQGPTSAHWDLLLHCWCCKFSDHTRAVRNLFLHDGTGFSLIIWKPLIQKS